MNLKWMLALAMAGHALCWYCDWLLIHTPAGNFTFADMKDNGRMERLFRAMKPDAPIRSMVLGAVALTMEFFGYMALCRWMEGWSAACASVMTVGAGVFFIVGAAHHVICGAAEWVYLRSGFTEAGREQTAELFRQTSATMFICYAGLMAFSVALLIAVATGATPLPAWACAFNPFVLYAVLAPFHVPGGGNIAGFVSFAALLILT